MLEDSIQKKIRFLKWRYKREGKAFRAKREKLQAYVENYFDKNNIRNDEMRLEEVAEILPDSRIREKILMCLYDLQSGEKACKAISEERGGIATGGVSEIGQTSFCKEPHGSKERIWKKNILNEIQHLAVIYQKKEKKLKESERKLNAFVKNYLDENNIWDDIEKLYEVIEALPEGILRLWLVHYKYDLLKEKYGLQQEISALLRYDPMVISPNREKK